MNVRAALAVQQKPGLFTSFKFTITAGSRIFLENLKSEEKELGLLQSPVKGLQYPVRNSFLFTFPHSANHGKYSPRGRARVRLAAGGSVSGGHCSQKSQQEGHSRFPL